MTERRRPWPQRLSLRTRMVLIAAGAVAAIVAVGGCLFLIAVRAELIGSADEVGEARAHQIADLAASGELPAELTADDDLEVAAQVVRSGTVVSATVNATDPAFFDLPEQLPGADDVDTVPRLPIDDDGPFRVVSLGTQTPEGNATVFVAINVEDVNDTLASLVGNGVIGLALLVVAVSGVCWVLIGRTLAPVDAISRQAEAITGQQLDQRVPVPQARDEIHRLAQTINDMLGRLELSAMRQERFVADAAHELRTPLASLRLGLETALARGDAKDDELLRDLLAETTRLSTLVDQLLLLARRDAGGIVRSAEPVDLDDVVTDVVRATQGDGRVDLRPGRIQPAQVLGGQALLEQVVRNLVDNAIRHASTTVEVSLTDGDGFAVLTVDDDGEGIPPQARHEVFRRFVRLDHARERADGGVGLGLAIVDEIVRLHLGTVEVLDSPRGGARLRVRIPVN